MEHRTAIIHAADGSSEKSIFMPPIILTCRSSGLLMTLNTWKLFFSSQTPMRPKGNFRLYDFRTGLKLRGGSASGGKFASNFVHLPYFSFACSRPPTASVLGSSLAPSSSAFSSPTSSTSTLDFFACVFFAFSLHLYFHLQPQRRPRNSPRALLSLFFKLYL